MRNLVILGMLLAGAFMAGWFTISRDGDRTTIELNRGEIRKDTTDWANRGREFLEREGFQQTGFESPATPDSLQPYPAQQPYGNEPYPNGGYYQPSNQGQPARGYQPPYQANGQPAYWPNERVAAQPSEPFSAPPPANNYNYNTGDQAQPPLNQQQPPPPQNWPRPF